MSTASRAPGQGGSPPDSGRTAYEQMQATPEFADLRRRFRTFVFPLTAAFLIWYFTYVLLAAYATDFFAQKVDGNINVGLLFGLGQFVTTALITAAYVRWADRNLDPPAERMRARLESTRDPRHDSTRDSAGGPR